MLFNDNINMKRIKLTQGQYTIVDEKNYEWLSKHKWRAQWSKGTASFYAVRSKYVNGKQTLIYMQREILRLGKGDKKQADHINHNTLDNRETNLRIVTCQQNHFNEKSPKGYYWNKNAKKYQAQIHVNGKLKYLGLFNNTKEAHQAYLQAKEKYHKL